MTPSTPNLPLTGAERQARYRKREEAKARAQAGQVEKLTAKLARRESRVSELVKQNARLKRALAKEKQAQESARLLMQDLAQSKYSDLYYAASQLVDVICRAAERGDPDAKRVLRSTPARTLDALTASFRNPNDPITGMRQEGRLED